MTDDPEALIDVPISLQLVGRRYEDETLLEGLRNILRVCGIEHTQGINDNVQ